MTAKLPNQVVEGFRLSPQQKHLWRLHKKHVCLKLGVQCTVSIRGPIDGDRMGEAVAQVRSRHEILRTNFALLEGTSVPVQAVDDSTIGVVEMIDLRGTTKTQGQSQILRVAKKQWNLLHQLLDVPPFFFALVTLSEDQHVLLVTASSLGADVASVVQVVREICEAYSKGDREDREILQYADLSEWQNQLLENAPAEDHSPYWTAAEFSDLSFPRLPFELRRETGTPEFIFNTIRRAVRKETAAALAALGRLLAVPVGSILLAAWEVVLHRTSGSDGFLIGAAMDGRVQVELRDAIGPFGKVLPLSVHVNGDLGFARLVEETNRSLKIAQFDQLLFDWKPFGLPDSSERRHLFPVLFASREEASPAMPHNWEFKSISECLESFELALKATNIGGALRLEFAWETSVFAHDDIARLADSCIALLEAIAKEPDCRISDLNIDVVRGSSARLLPAPAAEKTAWIAVHELIEAQARRVPEQLAVICEDDQITYAELDRRASALANRLEQAGTASDSLVAIFAERSVDFVVGIVAVLKAGAAWLPIEPDAPAERVEYMMSQARVVAVLTQRELTRPLSHVALPLVYLDDHGEPGDFGKARPHRAVHPHHLAYVIFTSGSTGRPKGVAIEHRQIAAYVQGEALKLKLSDCAHFALVSTMAADLGHSSVFGALSSGGCLHVIPAWRALDTEALARYFLQHPVDFVKIVPAHLEALCRVFPEYTRLPWRYLLAGGELLTWKLVELAQRFAPDCAVVNHYGPTETTVGVLCGDANLQSERFCGPNVPIGRPWQGTAAYLLDEQLRPVPAWMLGELYIGGDSVGRGYVGCGDLTAERFIPDPFHATPGSRMYRTGDLGRYRSDGQVEFVGRRDGQVKIRGYRVEPGEIEAALCCHTEVQNAAVVVVDRESGGKYLVAWVSVGSAKVTPEDLRSFLELRLPHYMIPGAFIFVDGLKLTPNGKVDRQALPGEAPLPAPSERVEPMDEIEESLLVVWKKVLNVERIGVEDNYFALGGDSLRVVQLVHEARRYGIIIAAAEVLRHQTIRRLRRALQAKLRQGLFPDGIPAAQLPSSDIIRLLPRDVADVYPVSGIQSFILEKYAGNRGSRGIYHIQDCLHMRDAGFSLVALETAFQAVVERHPALRTVFDLQSATPLQWVRRNFRWRINVEDISGLATAAQNEHIVACLRSDRARLFDPTDRETPLFRVALFLRGASEFELMFSCHHAIMDGWGHRVLLNQLLQAYINIKSGAPAELGQPDITCREFAAFQEAVRLSEQASAFWRSYLNGVKAPALVESGSPGPDPDNAEIHYPLETGLIAALLRVARDRAVSMQALMLSTWLEALRAWSGEQLVVTGVIVSGRSEHLTDPLSAVGLFWNIVPVVSRAVLPHSEQSAAVQKDLVEMEPYSAYPLPQLLVDQGRDLFFSVFRYLNFWNTQSIPEESGIELLGARAYDRYSFPVLCSAVVSSDSSGGYLRIEYDPGKLSASSAAAAMDRYAVLLQNLVAAPEA